MLVSRQFVVTGKQRSAIHDADFALNAAADASGLLIDVEASLISPGTELSFYREPVASMLPWPAGYTAAGVVREAGPASPYIDWIGRRVFLFPGDREQMACHASQKVASGESLLIPLPDELAAEDAVFMRMINIALTPYTLAGLPDVGTVLVVGLGLVGQTLGMVGRLLGHRVIAMDVSEARRERAAAWGADAVIDPQAGDAVETVRELTDGRGCELVVNATGLTSTFLTSIRCAAMGGELSTLGNARGPAPDELQPFLQVVQSNHVTVRGGWEMRLPRRKQLGSNAATTEANLATACRWLASGRFDVNALRTHVIEPEGMLEAYDKLQAGDPQWLGVAVRWR